MHIFLIMNETYNNTIRDIISKYRKTWNLLLKKSKKYKYLKEYIENEVDEKVKSSKYSLSTKTLWKFYGRHTSE